jgi:hypothetical protein
MKLFFAATAETFREVTPQTDANGTYLAWNCRHPGVCRDPETRISSESLDSGIRRNDETPAFRLK